MDGWNGYIYISKSQLEFESWCQPMSNLSYNIKKRQNDEAMPAQTSPEITSELDVWELGHPDEK